MKVEFFELSDELVEDLVDGGVLNVRIEMGCLHPKRWFDLKVGVVSLNKHRVAN